jgi:hypothetical protein
MAKTWTAEQIFELTRSYQSVCVLAAGVDWDLFTLLAERSLTAEQVATVRQADLRAATIILDALAALGLLSKEADRYRTPLAVAEVLVQGGRQSMLAMARHQAGCMRRWVQLSEVFAKGGPAQRRDSVRGEAADWAVFIEAMNDISAPVADGVVASLPRLEFAHLLDVGGGSGTWTAAFLRAYPQARATLFDLPAVIPQARQRLTDLGLSARVTLAAGDFYRDSLPGGADLAWVSAIVHQNSRAQNRAFFTRIGAALTPGGQIAIRDFVMDESRTLPPGGALFAVNMLVATQAGGTFTLAELREDLAAAGFGPAELVRPDSGMHAVVVACKA